MLGLVVCGLRTWMCTMAAPALAASIEERAICSGVTGTAGLRPGVSAEPVTAHEMMTLRCMGKTDDGGQMTDDRARMIKYRRGRATPCKSVLCPLSSVLRKRQRPRTAGARSSGVA